MVLCVLLGVCAVQEVASMTTCECACACVCVFDLHISDHTGSHTLCVPVTLTLPCSRHALHCLLQVPISHLGPHQTPQPLLPFLCISHKAQQALP